MKKLACVILFLHFIDVSWASDSTRYQLLDILRHYIRNEMQLDIGDEFYTSWNQTGAKISYVYVSRTDTLAPPAGVNAFIYIGEDPRRADSVCRKYEAEGLSTLHYRTAGTSDAMLNDALWSYPEEAFVYIVIHEAMHIHLRRSGKRKWVKYDQEEALCDATADRFTLLFLQKHHRNPVSAIRQQTINISINKVLRQAEMQFYDLFAKRKRIFRKLQSSIKYNLKEANAFQRDRYNYPVNQAYLMRCHSYAWNYFHFETQYKLYGTPAGVLSKLEEGN